MTMKKILSLVIGLLLCGSVIAQTSDASLTTQANQIRNETTPGANTAVRVGDMFIALIKSKQNIIGVATASGTDTYTATVNSGVVSYISGQVFLIKFTNANTGAATINVNGLGAKSIKKSVSTALSSGDIAAGVIMLLAYDGTNFQLMGGSGGGALVDGDYGDVTVSGTGTVITIDNVAVTNAKINDVAVGKITGLGTGVATALAVNVGSAGAPVLYNGAGGTPSALVGTNITGTASGLSIGGNAATATTMASGSIYTLDRATPVTTGGTITLDMNSQKQRMHLGSASFATAKIIALSNTTNSLVFNFTFTITNVAAVLTMPSDFIMGDTRWETTGNTWTPTQTGQYEMAGSYDGTNWLVKISALPYN